ncbi:SpvB/TcaC N-terminal domain-containing protein [Sorangium sp. So ce124]|uniref:SpvB/TcaC N-terminal domain-containing protein n=1 Tax=Sorangium sp. So ce124 TaxID=3133280 RepID=UPI003F60C0A5
MPERGAPGARVAHCHTSVYGRSQAARIADPARPEHIFSWLLDETRGDKDNVVTYEYKAEDLTGVARDEAAKRHRRAGRAPVANRYPSTETGARRG